MLRFRFGLSMVLVNGTILLLAAGPLATEPPEFPGKDWTTRAPAEVGMAPAGLQAFSELVGGRGCVVRHGSLVYTWGNAAQRGDVASACKPWFSHFLFKALEDGKLRDVDEPVALRWEPRLNRLNADLGFKDREITWRHFAIPGQRSLGSTQKPDNQCDHLGSYSWLWWTNGIDRDGGRHWPDAPADMYGCFGHGGPRVMIVIPSLDLVMSWNDAKIKSREAENAAFRQLVQSVVR